MVQSVSRNDVKLFELYRRQGRCSSAMCVPAFISRFDTAAHQADEARMELAACNSELAFLTSAWKKKRQELGSQVNKYKSRFSALERKRSSDTSDLAHDVNCLQRRVHRALTQLAGVKATRGAYLLPTPASRCPS